MYKNKTKALLCALLLSATAMAQETITNKEGSDYTFKVVVDNEASGVVSQGNTGTCWSFSTLSFFESELKRLGKGDHNLSEMFIVRKAYEDKAEMYVRMHGKNNFDEGGAFVDIPHVIRQYGIVPEEVYKGLNYDSELHNHSEMAEILRSTMDAVVKNKQGSLTPQWDEAVDGILDAYLGKIPEKFTYQGKEYTPQSYAESLGLNLDDYVSISSFTHHPYYTQFVLEVPDNWTFGRSYNVPLNEMMEVMDYALNNKYTFAWGADVSEKGFSFRNALAIVPENEADIDVKGKDNKHFNDAGADKESSAFETPKPEKNITAEMRQKAFDNYETTDDHGMHATGIVEDQKGNKYYIIKNSWGTKYNDCDGYFYASEAYVKYKTINFMVHKDGIPKEVKKKLGIK